MKRLSNVPSYYLEIMVFMIMAFNKEKGEQIFTYFFPLNELNISVEEQIARREVLDPAANEVGFKSIEKILQKLMKAYRKIGNGKVLSEQATYDVVKECLSKSRQVKVETKQFNQFIQTIIQKGTA